MNNISNTSSTTSTTSRYRNLIISSSTNSEYFSRYAEILLDYINLLADENVSNTESQEVVDDSEDTSNDIQQTTENALNYIPNLSNVYDKLNTDLNFIYDG